MERWMLAVAAGTVALVMTADAATAADLERGEKVFKRCEACHTLGAGEKHLEGPNLHGIFGRKAGTVEGFAAYSPALKDSGIVWSAETMSAFLEKPKEVVPNNNMSFTALRKVEDREALIAFLQEKTK